MSESKKESITIYMTFFVQFFSLYMFFAVFGNDSKLLMTKLNGKKE